MPVSKVNGWTVVTPSADSRLIYIASNGNDATAFAVKNNRGYYLPSDPEIGPDPTNPIGPIMAYANPRSALKRVRSTGFDPNSPIGKQNVSTTIRDATDASGGGWPDWLLYRRGDTFTRLSDYQSPGWGVISGELGGMMRVGWGDNIGTWSGPQGDPMFRFEAGFFSGRSVSEPLVIGAWGPPTTPRPVIHGGFTVLPQLRNTVIASLDVQVSPDEGLAGRRTGLNFQTGGESAYGAWRNVFIEDCRSQGHGMIQIIGGGPSTNLTIRRSVYTDGWSNDGHNSSPYVGLEEGAKLTLEECVFDRNGYKENPDAPQTWTATHISNLTTGTLPIGTGVQPTRTWFDRNWYLSGKNGLTLRVRGNIASRTGGGSEQFRSGGVAERNLLLFNHDSFVGGSDPAQNDDAPFVVRNNVHLHDDAMLPPGGYGMNTFIRGLKGVYFVDNIFAHNHFDQNGPGTLGISGWISPWKILNNVVRSTKGLRGWGIEGLTVGKEIRGNKIAIDEPLLWIGASPTASLQSNDQIDENMYLGNSSSLLFLKSYSGTPRDINPNTTFTQWQAAGYDPNGQIIEDWSAFKTAAGWTDPDKDIVSYMESIDPTYVTDEDVRVDFGCSGSLQTTPQLVRNVVSGTDAKKRQIARRFHAFVTFINRARENHKGAWDQQYTAEAVINYIRAGFGKTSITGDYDTRDINSIVADYLYQHGPVNSLVLTTQPVGDISGQLLAVQPIVTLRDASNVTTSSDNATQVSVAIQSGSNGTLTGTTTVTVVNGVATFTDLVLNGTDGEPYVLRFSITSPALNVDSVNVVVTDEILPPTTVKVTREPQAGLSGTIFTTQPKIVLEDNLGSIVSSDSITSVTAAITGGLGGTLTGTTTVIAVNGIVEFTDLVLTGNPNQQYTISFTSSGLISDSSTVTLQSVVSPPAPTTNIPTDLIRTGKYFGEVYSLNIDGEFNKSDLLSLRLNQTRMIGVGTQDFIVKYRNTILKTKNIDFNIPEDWDLFWSFKQGPIINPNLVVPCFLWLKPENFTISSDGTKYTALENAGNLSNFIDNFSAEEGNEALRSYIGLNSFSPLSFNGTSNVYVHDQESGDFSIPTQINFSLAFVLTTNNINTNKENAVFSIGKEGETGSLQVFVDETNGERKISITSYVGGEQIKTNTTDDCYNQGDSIIVLFSRIQNSLNIRINGKPKSLIPRKLPNIAAISTGSYIGAVNNFTTNTLGKFLNHDLYEVILAKEVIDFPISISNLETIEGYLAAKYKLESVLPTNHAYKNEPPRTTVVQDETTKIPINPPPSISCYVVSAVASSISPPSDETTETVAVTVVDSNCQWEASTAANWITLTNPFNIGNGSFSYTVDENTGEERVGTITITSGSSSPVVLTITQAAGIAGIVATGGTVTDAGGYRYHTFTSDGTFTVTAGGSMDILVVGGGGGGGIAIGGGGGGGGGGVVVLDNETLAADSYAVTVGSGGAAAAGGHTVRGTNGGNSSFGVYTAAVGGGGGGGHNAGASPNTGGSGGGGGGGQDSATNGAAGTSGQGNAGGNGWRSFTGNRGIGGGGGGAGAAGGNATSTVAGAGGNGLLWHDGTYYAGGGGGVGQLVATPDEYSYGAPGSGTVGRGGRGGMGHVSWLPATAGNNGTVIIRYAI